MESGIGRARNHDLIDLCFGLGLSVERTAWVCGESLSRCWHEWSVRTGLPTPADPTPSAIKRRAREVKRGWTEDLEILARHGITLRPSSETVRYRNEARQAGQRIRNQRKTQKAREQRCHFDSIGAKANPSRSPEIVTQMMLSFESTASGATACG